MTRIKCKAIKAPSLDNRPMESPETCDAHLPIQSALNVSSGWGFASGQEETQLLVSLFATGQLRVMPWGLDVKTAPQLSAAH